MELKHLVLKLSILIGYNNFKGGEIETFKISNVTEFRNIKRKLFKKLKNEEIIIFIVDFYIFFL